MYRNSKPMATRSQRERDNYRSGEDYSDCRVGDGTGGKVSVRRYSDGSSTYDFGMCGKVSYNKYGEEC